MRSEQRPQHLREVAVYFLRLHYGMELAECFWYISWIERRPRDVHRSVPKVPGNLMATHEHFAQRPNPRPWDPVRAEGMRNPSLLRLSGAWFKHHGVDIVIPCGPQNLKRPTVDGRLAGERCLNGGW